MGSQFKTCRGLPHVRSGGLRGMDPCLTRLVGHAGDERGGDGGANHSSDFSVPTTGPGCAVEIVICAIVTKPYDRSATAVKGRLCASV